MASNPSYTGDKQPKKKKIMPKGKPFEKGDPRINRNGRPKSFDQLRALFQNIAEEEITLNGKKYTRAEAIGLAMSADKKLMRDFLEYAYGKVPQKLEHEIQDELTEDERITRLTALLDAARTRRDGQASK